MKVRVLRPALNDLAAGRRFYGRQQSGISAYFFDSVFADIDSVALYAGIHRIEFGFHRKPASRFPYAIYYPLIEGEAVVFRILDCRRDPKWIRKTLEAER
jgi:hypothetical protein